MSSAPPTARQVHATTEAARTERTHSERSNPPAQGNGSAPLFGDRSDRPDTFTSTVPHTTDPKLDDLGSGSSIAETQRIAPNQPSMTIGTHAHTHGITDVTRARREGSAS